MPSWLPCAAHQSEAESERDQLHTTIQGAHREHSDARSRLEAARARAQELQSRRTRLEAETAEVTRESGVARESVERARAALGSAQSTLANWNPVVRSWKPNGTSGAKTLTLARARAQAAQVSARDLIIRSESRRSQEASVATGLARMTDQRRQVSGRCEELDAELAGGDAPITQLQSRLDELLSRQIEVQSELDAARRALEDAESRIGELEQQRSAAEARVAESRDAIEQARLAAQESRVRPRGPGRTVRGHAVRIGGNHPGPATGGNRCELGRISSMSCAPTWPVSARSILPRSMSSRSRPNARSTWIVSTPI
ncbi:MAG: hypothetical protein WDM77_20015 [Steroidobacteraceae bacterium]